MRLQGKRLNYTVNGVDDGELETLILNLESKTSLSRHKVERWLLGLLTASSSSPLCLKMQN
uniref:Uncharacterized protein n=1 Tax=Rosa rugosa TaxID=74645 RepID=J7FY83_ROSRU|nr:hypothetical protein [Rosa rugosa]